MKIATVVGARPQFIKAAALSRVLRKEHREVLIHTGQHHDANMSDVFFKEMDIPAPDYNLGIAGGSHGQMTGRMLIAIEEVLLKEQPDMLLLYGDTNSTLAGALAAAKLHIPIAHVESGNRTGSLTNPEEINRICTDHISSWRFACVKSAMDFLAKENLADHSYLVGDPMFDAFLYYSDKLDCGYKTQVLDHDGQLVHLPPAHYYLTCHREENTATASSLSEILSAVNQLDAPVVYPVHPRNRALALELKSQHHFNNVIMVQPVGYYESIDLIRRAKKIITDSGGVQREAFFAHKPCVTILDFVCWPETMVNGCNRLARPNREDILEKLSLPIAWPEAYRPFGDGHACEKICETLGESEEATQ